MYEFKQAVKIEGKTFHLGRHNVPDEILSHPDFLHFVKCGWIAEVDAQKVSAPLETFAERSQRLAKKLAEKTAPKAQPTEQVHEGVQEKEAPKSRKAKAEKGE